jgi:tape measure domain-containing protein
MLADLSVKISADIKKLQKNINTAKATIQGFGKSVTSVGTNLSAKVSLPLIGIGAVALKTASNFEDLRISFQTLTGSVEKGNKVFEDLRQFASVTPFQTADLAKATQTMLSFGISADDTIKNLRMLGDVAMGDSQKLGSLTLAFSQIQSTGRLMGQDLLQLINAGFNPLTIIAEKTGKSVSQLKDEMSKGAISAEMVTDAFRIATSEGGLFFNGMEKGSKTLSGVFSTLKDTIAEGMGEIGVSIVDAFDLKRVIKDVTGFVSRTVQAFTNLDAEIRRKMIIGAVIVGAIGPVIIILGQLTMAISALILAVKVLFSPITLVIAIFMGIVIATQSVIDNFDLMQMQVRRSMFKMAGAVLSKSADILETILAVAEGSGMLAKALQVTLGATGLSLVGTLDSINKKMRGFSGEIKTLDQQIDQTDTVGLMESLGNLGDTVKNVLSPIFGKLKDMFPDMRDEIQEFEDKIVEASSATKESAKNILEAYRALGVASLASLIDATTTAFADSLFLANEYNTKELELRKYNLDQQKIALNESLANQLISQEEYSLRVALLNQEMLDNQIQMDRARENAFKRSMRALGQSAKDAVKQILAEFAKLAIIKSISSILGLEGVTTAGGVAEGIFGKLFGKQTSVNDALITSSGNVVKFHPDDNILAMKSFSPLANMNSGSSAQAFEKALQSYTSKLSPNEFYTLSQKGRLSF